MVQESTSSSRGRRLGRRQAITLASIALALNVIAGCHSSQQSAPSTTPAPPTQVELPFAGLMGPKSVVVDAAGNVYVTDSSNTPVRKMPARSDVEVKLPITGLKDPTGIAVDSAGNVYVADGTNRIRRIDPSGNVTTLAGNGSFGYADGTGGADGTAD